MIFMIFGSRDENHDFPSHHRFRHPTDRRHHLWVGSDYSIYSVCCACPTSIACIIALKDTMSSATLVCLFADSRQRCRSCWSRPTKMRCQQHAAIQWIHQHYFLRAWPDALVADTLFTLSLLLHPLMMTLSTTSSHQLAVTVCVPIVGWEPWHSSLCSPQRRSRKIYSDE